MTPSPSLLRHLSDEMRSFEPFGRMAQAGLQALLASARESYYAPDEIVLGPASGVATRLLWIRRGGAIGRTADAQVFELEAGELFPLGALLGARPASTTYVAEGDLFCLEFDAAAVQHTIDVDPVFAEYVNHRLRSDLALSRAQWQTAHASRVLAEQSFETPLSTLVRRVPIAVGPGASLHEGLALMQRHHVGSVLVLDAHGAALGILTRHDLLQRIVLHEPPLDIRATPITAVMSAPLQTLDVDARVHDAALLMSLHGIRHLPLTEAGRVVSILSERDLFALQKLSLKALSTSLRDAPDEAALCALAPRIREFARQLLAQGLASHSLTALISHLNDLLCQRLLERLAAQHGLDLMRACWLAFGSEGRGEQTIATDQDNGLVLVDEVSDEECARWLAFARAANQALDACGYPLCKGGVMAGNPACCLRQREWQQRFERWIEQGAPADLLSASIYFDLRTLAGNAALAAPLREFITTRAAAVPRFIRQLAENALQRRPALNWRGGIATTADEGHEWIDLKLGGSAVFVDAARLFALAQGIAAVGTAQRLRLAGVQLGAPATEYDGWVSAFDVVQLLRLRVQVDAGAATLAHPNRLDVNTLNHIDRRLLKEALRVARQLQQRIELDWMR